MNRLSLEIFSQAETKTLINLTNWVSIFDSVSQFILFFYA